MSHPDLLLTPVNSSFPPGLGLLEADFSLEDLQLQPIMSTQGKPAQVQTTKREGLCVGVKLIPP